MPPPPLLCALTQLDVLLLHKRLLLLARARARAATFKRRPCD